MQHPKIDAIIAKIKELESELESQIQEEYDHFACEIAKKREEIRERYQRDKISTLRYILSTPLWFFLTVPVIWGVLIPALFLDAVVTFYQWFCFPIYKIQKVKRSDYITYDRHKLDYLNTLEKINCLYCSYFNGLMAYVSEVSARTEQFWCPIRHAKRIKSMHSRYANFIEYGDSKSYREELESLRKALEALDEER
ncbi:MAG: hypothetical protein KU37_04900 [Sulfuricurvum sp. PC08-66]|nr:MAG: hypothetical protein KU37_04900 [Sulfuricurvum sp. PC08-66]